MTPTVQAVSRSKVHGFSKQPQPSVRLIPGEGVEGDAHRGVTTQHLYRMKRDPSQPNLCQVHLLASEKLAEVAAKGFHVEPGDLGENILTADLDLHALPTGTRLTLGAHAVIEVTGERTPCSKIDDFRPGLQQHLWGLRDALDKKSRRAGIMAIVLTAGEVRAGDTIRIERPIEPHTPLGPV